MYLCINQPVSRVHNATPSSWRRVDGVEVMVQQWQRVGDAPRQFDLALGCAWRSGRRRTVFWVSFLGGPVEPLSPAITHPLVRAAPVLRRAARRSPSRAPQKRILIQHHGQPRREKGSSKHRKEPERGSVANLVLRARGWAGRGWWVRARWPWQPEFCAFYCLRQISPGRNTFSGP